MKKMFLVLLAVVLVCGTPLFIDSSSAGIVKENAGCGVGSMAFGDKDGVLYQLFATFTNGISGNQTFGMSTGTLECKPAKFAASNEKLNKFVSENMDGLAQDIAAGQGERLETLAELMDIPSDERDSFYVTVQKNFSNIYTSQNIQSANVIDNIILVTKQS
jgi:hypothetical protein